MKKVEAVIEACKVDQVREALAKKKMPRVSIFEVKARVGELGDDEVIIFQIEQSFRLRVGQAIACPV